MYPIEGVYHILYFADTSLEYKAKSLPARRRSDFAGSNLLNYATDLRAVFINSKSDARGRFIRIEHHAMTNGSGAVTKDVTKRL